MPKTAIINPRRRRPAAPKRRRRNPAAKLYGSAANPRRRRRRRNPDGNKTAIRKVYSAGGYRKKNPALDFDQAIDIMPGATAGDLLARWAVHVAGPMEDGKPGIAHAIACYIAAVFGSDLIGSVLGSPEKARYAQIGALAFGGSLFARKLFLAESEWAEKNLYLGDGDEDEDDNDDDDDELAGFTDQSALSGGQEFIDEQGRRWMQTAAGWTLLSGDYQPQTDPANVGGFVDQSNLGRYARNRSSFGYA